MARLWLPYGNKERDRDKVETNHSNKTINTNKHSTTPPWHTGPS
eukprot:SAG22_NODE_8391_length_659_cov_1.571429_2_plen_43_part_01